MNGTRNELIKLPVQVKIEVSAMMGICIYWIRRHLIFAKSLWICYSSGGHFTISLIDDGFN